MHNVEVTGPSQLLWPRPWKYAYYGCTMCTIGVNYSASDQYSVEKVDLGSFAQWYIDSL